MMTEAEQVIAWLGTSEGREWSQDMHAPARPSRDPVWQGLFGEIRSQPDGLFSVDLGLRTCAWCQVTLDASAMVEIDGVLVACRDVAACPGRPGGPGAQDPGERPGDPDPMPGIGPQGPDAQREDDVAGPATPDTTSEEIHQEWLEELGRDG